MVERRPLILEGGELKELPSGDTLPSTGGGAVLQIVGFVTETQTYQAIGTSDTILGGITKTITPIGINSKFLISIRWIGECSQSWNATVNIHADGVRVNNSDTGPGRGLCVPLICYHNVNNDSTAEAINFQTLYQSNSLIGTPIKFDLVADRQNWWTNRCFNANGSSSYERGSSEIIITEIAGN